MPTQATIAITPGSGQLLDAVSLIINAQTVVRETMVIADPTSPTQLATVNAAGALNVFDAILEGCITANVLSVSLPTTQITTLTPPTAAAIGTAVSTDLLIGTQLAAVSVPVALPTATITTLTPPTAAVIASAIVANPPTTFNGVVTNAGTFAVQATIGAGSAVIGHVITDSGSVTNATLAAETTKIIGTTRITGNIGGVMDTTPGSTKPANALQVGGSDGTNLQALSTDTTGVLLSRPAAPTLAKWSQASVSFSSSGANVLVAGVASQTVRIMRIFFVNSNITTSTNITIQDTTPTSFSGAFLVGANGGSFSADGDGEPLYISASGKGIQLNSSSAVQISGTVWYTQS